MTVRYNWEGNQTTSLLTFLNAATTVPHVTENKACGTEAFTDCRERQQAFV